MELNNALNNPRIIRICFAYGCGNQILIKQYNDNHDAENPLFCHTCWERVYNAVDLLAMINDDDSSAYRQENIKKESERIMNKPNSSCKMQCSEHCAKLLVPPSQLSDSTQQGNR